jgi:hypothetical protein
VTASDNPFLPATTGSDDILAPYRGTPGDIKLRKGAGRSEIQAYKDYHRTAIAIRVEKAIFALASMSLGDLKKIVDQIGLDIMQTEQDTMAEAEATLNPEYLRMYQAYLHRSRGQGLNDILQLQFLAGENLREMVVDLPTYQQLPPEKKSLIDRLLDFLRSRKS